MMEVVLLIIAWILNSALALILVVVGCIISILFGNISGYSKRVALAIDRLGNVMGGPLFNLILKKEGGHDFGDFNDTISRVLGINWTLDNLTWLGGFIGRILNLIDRDHLRKSI